MTTITVRNQIITLVNESIASGARQDRACAATNLSERALQRWQRDARHAVPRGDQRQARIQTPKNQLTVPECQQLLAVANSDEFARLPPCQIVPRLADQRCYFASESSFYRVLNAAKQLKHRGSERPAQARSKPRALCATAPNQLISWDITYLPTQFRGIYFYLYFFMDIFSRKVVGWQVYETESSEQASEVMRDICVREGIAPHQLVLHSDNGSPIKGVTLLATLQSLGVMPSFSRPAVSNDNPYSESLFKTLKYRSDYPQHATEMERMRHALLTKAGRALYAQRKCTVEPVIGIIKSVLGFRQFSLRGLENVKGELNLVAMAWNLKLMFVLAG